MDNTKAQLRLSQRTVAQVREPTMPSCESELTLDFVCQLTRQTEDLKDGRERLRLENEGLNNVVARKERLLQEVLAKSQMANPQLIT